MKCINDKCENGLWSEDGCLFPEGTICADFIPEAEKSGVVPVDSLSTGSVPLSDERLIQIGQKAGFTKREWKALTYESGQYDVTTPTIAFKRLAEILMEQNR